MTPLISSKSSHLMNTGKVAKAMAGAMNATLKNVGEVRPEDLAGYDLVGIGSGSLFSNRLGGGCLLMEQ